MLRGEATRVKIPEVIGNDVSLVCSAVMSLMPSGPGGIKIGGGG